MNVPLLGPVSLTGFSHIWWLLFFSLVVLGLVGLYFYAQRARRRRLQQFANTELLDSVAPKRPSVWRHVPAALLPEGSRPSRDLGAPLRHGGFVRAARVPLLFSHRVRGALDPGTRPG